MSKVYVLVDERLMAAKNPKRSRHPRHFVVAAYSSMKKAQEAADGYLEALSFAPQGQGWKQGKLKGEITKTESSGKKSDKYGSLHATYRDDEAVLGHLRILTLTVNQPPEDEIDYMTAETFNAESEKLGIILRIDRDDKTADILGVFSSYAEGKKAMTHIFKEALKERAEDYEEPIMTMAQGKKEFEWYESRSKKRKHLDFYHPTAYDDVIILKEYGIETLADFEENWGAETFVAENSDAMEVIIEALDTIKYPDIDDDSHITNEVYDILQQGADEDDSSDSMDAIFEALDVLNYPDIDDVSYNLNEVKDILQSAASKSAETFNAESKFDKLAKEIASDYRKKGKSPEEALEIGEATAAKIGRAKYGKKKFSRMGKKAENFTNDLIPAFGLGAIGAIVYSIFLNGKKE